MIRSLTAYVLLAIILAGLSCGSGGKESAVEEKATAVTLDLASQRDLSVIKVYTGTLEGVRQAQIFASIPEAVVELPTREGTTVKAGQPIIYLDKSGTYSRYNQTRAVYADAKDNYEKMDNLYKQGAVSEQAYNAAKTAYEVAQANFVSSKQQVELTSPINGVLTNLAVNIGEYAPLGIPLATVAQTDVMRMTLYVDTRSASHIKIGQSARIDVDVLTRNSPQFSGRVIEISKSADPTTRLFKVEIRVDNKNGDIKPGMFARAQLIVADLKSVLTVPSEAVFSVEGVQKVYQFSDGHAREISISAGESTEEFTQVLSGLSPGDSVIVIGRNLIEDGSPVKIAGEIPAPDSIVSDQGSSSEG